MAFFSCFFLAAVATATAPVTPSSHVLFRRIQREGLMLKGLSTPGRFVPAAGPSQAMAATWRAVRPLPQPQPCFGGCSRSLNALVASRIAIRLFCGGCNRVVA